MRSVFCFGVCALAAVCCADKDNCGSTCSTAESDDLSLIQLRRRANLTEDVASQEGVATVGEAVSTEEVNATGAMCMCSTGKSSASCCQRRRGSNSFQWPPAPSPGGGDQNNFNWGGGGGDWGGGGGGGGSTCDEKPGGFTCPENLGCPDGNCNEDGPGGWESWVDIHNIYRCMHDVPPVVWSNAMYANVKKVFQNQQQMSHSDCYGVQPPAGPAGENLAWASWSLSGEQATKMWYDEVNDCGSFPGCKSGSSGVTGHFTALIWDGVKEIGCHANVHGLRACQYRGGDSKDCTTPNMGGHYETNVFKPVFSKAECEKRVDECKQGGSSGGNNQGGSGDATSPDDGKKKKKKKNKGGNKKKKKNKGGNKKKKNKKNKKKKRNFFF